MNDKERFIETMIFGNPDRVPLWECAFWREALERWICEGMPKEVLYPGGTQTGPTEESLRAYFGFDRSFGVYFRKTVPINVGLCPMFERKILTEVGDMKLERGSDGVVVRRAAYGQNTRQFVRFPVESREDFKEIKPRLDPNSLHRFPDGWADEVKSRQNMGAPVCMQVGGYYGFARSLMGLENLSYAFHDQMALVEEIFEYRTWYICEILENALQKVTPDFAEFWEDMAFKSGSLVSPKLYRRIALRHYRAVTDLLRKHGVRLILLDSDGNVDDLIPIWIDGGINIVWPLEIASGTDPVSLRKKYGNSLGLIGGIDKRAMAKGKREIREEVMSKVPFLVESGGFIATCDHAVPADVPLDYYLYYLELIREISMGR